MTYSLPASAPHSFRPYPQQPHTGAAPAPSAARAQYHSASYDYDGPMQQPAPYRRRVDEAYSKHSLSAPGASASASSSNSSFSPLSLCSSVSSCSSSSSGSSSSAYSSPADTFDLEEMGDDLVPHPGHHQYYQQHPHPHPSHQTQYTQSHRGLAKPAQALQGKPGPQMHHQPSAQDSAVYYPPPPPQVVPAATYGHTHSPPPMTVSIPAPNGGWKELPRRRELPSAHPQLVSAELPAYLPGPVAPVVASAAEVMVDGGKGTGGKKKKGRSLRRCMDREKHSKAEQKRRGEMKLLFDQLQDISQCVYKDRIHILTLAIQTIQRQQDTIQELQQQQQQQATSGKARSKAVKKEAGASNGAAIVASGCSSPSSSASSTPEQVSAKRAAVAAELECEPSVVVKQEEAEASGMPSSPKKQRTSPQPREVVDLSSESVFGAPLASAHEVATSTVSALASSSYVSKPLHNSFSSSSLSNFVCPSVDTPGSFPYLMDEQSHGPFHAADDSTVSKSQLAGPGHHGAIPSHPSYQPTMSPVFSFTAHPQQWWPSTAESVKH